MVARLTGTSDTFSLEGTIYFPKNHLDASGTDYLQIGNQLIVNTIFLTGTGVVEIMYDGRNPAPGYETFLVL